MNVEPEFLATFFGHQIALKMFHLQTKRYGAHKASDAYAETFADNFDRFMEVAQGELGEIKTSKKLSLKVNLVTDDTIVAHLDRMVDFLRGLEVGDQELSSELDTIRGDMIKEIQKLKYLLRFE